MRCLLTPQWTSLPTIMPVVREETPTLRTSADGRQVSCHPAEELILAGVFD
ncbi:MAG: hypothetical protein OXP68_13790 [Anaerolineaceae bacterium]|nr:hypothetical protein [Anaerolineaceae bacterium]MDE0328808.1 hypothetical protein [Anaerolineaceae bacterium]